MSQVIDGKSAAAAVRDAVRQEVAAFQRQHGRAPGLATVLVGDHAASASYVRSKRKACADLGIASDPHELPSDITQADLLRLIGSLNERRDIHGILVQLPLPSHIDAAA